MRKLLTTIAGAGLAILGTSIGAAQGGASATTTARSYQLTGFDQIGVVGPHRILVAVGPAFSIRAEGPQKTLDDTKVEIDGGRLEIHPDKERWEQRCGRRGDGRNNRCWDDYQPATFHVTLPQITGASLVGGGSMAIDRIEGSRFSASVAGTGDLDVAAMRVDDAKFSIAGEGGLSVRGSARRSRVSIAGSGNFRAREMASDEASISIAGSGDVALTVRDDARVSIVGAGDVEISGPARCAVSRVGGGRVRCNGETVSS